MEKPLSDLKPGQTGKVISVKAERSIRKRMLAMGLCNGAEVQMVRVAPLGDPVEFKVRGYSLSLRKNEAEQILIEETN